MKNDRIINIILTGANGTLSIIFGLIALLFPSITIAGLAIYFAISIIIGSIGLLSSAVKYTDNSNRTIEAILGLIAGLIILFNPNSTVAVFTTILGLLGLASGIVLLLPYIKSRDYNSVHPVTAMIGVISFIFGIIIMINPFKSSKFLTVVIGIFALAYGIFSLIKNTRNPK